MLSTGTFCSINDNRCWILLVCVVERRVECVVMTVGGNVEWRGREGMACRGEREMTGWKRCTPPPNKPILNMNLINPIALIIKLTYMHTESAQSGILLPLPPSLVESAESAAPPPPPPPPRWLNRSGQRICSCHTPSWSGRGPTPFPTLCLFCPPPPPPNLKSWICPCMRHGMQR